VRWRGRPAEGAGAIVGCVGGNGTGDVVVGQPATLTNTSAKNALSLTTGRSEGVPKAASEPKSRRGSLMSSRLRTISVAGRERFAQPGYT
jgi:hypothetical protein